MRRIILHVDANSFFASVELLDRPDLKTLPVAVCGSEKDRHGIVLAKNQPAKEMGVKTAEPVWQAKRKCPQLVVLPPHHEKYMRYSRILRNIYEDYTDQVEPYGLDEAWLNISQPGLDYDRAKYVADEIRLRARAETGLTVSVGVSFTHALAKLGSDMKKPDGTTMITPDNFQSVIWPKDVGDLLYVGGHTLQKLKRLGLNTIGDLARADTDLIEGILGKNGPILKAYALGIETDVMKPDRAQDKSLGHSVTPYRDIESMDEVKCIIYMLTQEVLRRLRDKGYTAGCVKLSMRKTDLRWYSVQCRLCPSTRLTDDIAKAAIDLFLEKGMLPLRGMGLTLTRLGNGQEPVQTDLLGQSERRIREEQIQKAEDALRRRYGGQPVKRGMQLISSQLFYIKSDSYQDTSVPFHAV